MATNDAELDEQRALVADRVEFLDLLAEEAPLEPRDVVDVLDHSRSTVTRALRTLREADLIERTADGYVPTPAGVMAADAYHRYETASKAVLAAKEVLAPLPPPQAPPVDLLVGGDVIHSGADAPLRPLAAVADRVRDADAVQAYLPTLVNTDLLRAWHRGVVGRGVESEVVFDPDLLTVLKGQYPHLLAEMAGTGAFEAATANGPSWGVVLTTTGDATTTSVIVYEDETAVRGVVINDSPAAVEWAREQFDRLRAEAADVTADVNALSTAVADGMAGRRSHGVEQSRREEDSVPETAERSLPLDLEADGFVRLSEEYFDTHRTGSPTVSWRTGFTLADVRAGHAVDRLDDDGDSLTDSLLAALRNGDDHVLLGPPGSGKSTICMAVACAWYDRDVGTVLYRERGNGDAFDSAALLETYLRRANSHVLVVVEDAVRQEANAVFPVAQALADAPDVTFLLDARTGVWRDTDAFEVDARLDTFRRTAIERRTVPTLDRRECERFVEQFAALVDADLALSGADLFALVAGGDETREHTEVSPGRALVAQHFLTREVDPAASGEDVPLTVLDESVRAAYRHLADADADLALDLGVLVNVLNAAGLPVAREYLYAIAPGGEYAAIEATLPVLEGRLLFERDGLRAGTRPTTYRTRHELWSERFLETVLDAESTRCASERFGRCVTRLLALADDSERRRGIERHLGGRAPGIHRIAADPENWADEALRRLFGVGLTNGKLAPLFGETGTSLIELPACCSTEMELQVPYWRGEMNILHADLERAEREFRTLCERAETVDTTDQDLPVPSLLDYGTTSIQDIIREQSSVENARDTHWKAAGLTNLGLIARGRGDVEATIEYYEKSLELYREIGYRYGEADVLDHLGVMAAWQGDLEAADEYLEMSLGLSREIGHSRQEAWTLANRGAVARERGDPETAEEYLEESVELSREIGQNNSGGWALGHLAVVACERGNFEAARERLDEAHALAREIGSRRIEAITHNFRGTVARERGDLEAAERCHGEALAVSREIGQAYSEAWALVNLGIVAVGRGDLETAGEYLEEGLARLRGMDHHLYRNRALTRLAEITREHGADTRVRSQFEDVADLFPAITAEEATDLVAKIVNACERQGDVDAALDWCQQAIEFAEHHERPEMREEFSTRRTSLMAGDEPQLSP